MSSTRNIVIVISLAVFGLVVLVGTVFSYSWTTLNPEPSEETQEMQEAFIEWTKGQEQCKIDYGGDGFLDSPPEYYDCVDKVSEKYHKYEEEKGGE